jgi:hypothetical protein
LETNQKRQQNWCTNEEDHRQGHDPQEEAPQCYCCSSIVNKEEKTKPSIACTSCQEEK